MPVPTQEPPPTTIPHDLLEAVRRAQGVDVSDVPIHRGPGATDEARALGARSFTRDAEVFLPAHAGPPDQPDARGLLAHELTHAAQQRTFGAALPAEDSEAGRALEAQALAAERWARGLGTEPAASGFSGFGPQGTSGFATPQMTSWTAPWLTAPSTTGVQRQAADVMSVAAPDFTPAPIDMSTAMDTGTFAPTPPTTVPNPTVPNPTEPPPQAAPQAAADEEMSAARDRLLDLSKRRPLDLDDPADIEELSVRIYQKIHRRLRRDLVVDRERSGRLGETGPFGPAR